jgi:hypothetical protein
MAHSEPYYEQIEAIQYSYGRAASALPFWHDQDALLYELEET